MSTMGASQPQVPPWLQEQLVKFQKTQQELQMITMQKQQLDMEKVNMAKTLEELKKAKDDETVFKFAGSVMIKSTKPEMMSELEENQELTNTRLTVIGKQEARLHESLKEQEANITQAMKRGSSSSPSPQTSSTTPQPPSI